ncbi:MAG: phosphoenolpyruvate carboxylase [Nitrososphaeria archaeon]|nr:phosphoenolpyruvate carboxylase [Nitrososphaeria archaeon]
MSKARDVDRKIPHTMASQHPDHSLPPPWSKEPMIAGEDEVIEAYWAYAKYGIEEVMWDAEGKDVDVNVVRKLFTNYPDFFKENILGRDIFLTLRLPNPSIEGVERKTFLETLESIPRHNDVAKAFYGDSGCPALFEVILPFTTSYIELLRIKESYRKAVITPLRECIDCHGTTLGDWIGNVEPEDIEVIPLIEDMDTFLKIDTLLTNYIEAASPSYIRVFLARSDPAMNYGFISAVLLAKYGLWLCRRVSERSGIPIYPIIGAGALPFRGHNSPHNVDSFLDEYRGIYTVTIQSAFRYDYPVEVVSNAVRQFNSRLPNREAMEVDGEVLRRILTKLVSAFQVSVESAAQAINYVASFVPSRRARKQHVGLFGYARMVGSKRLPRAIPFTAALYSLGMPPEFIGARALDFLDEEEYDFVINTHVKLREDLEFAARKVSLENISLIKDHEELIRKIFGPEFLETFLPKYLDDLRTVEERFGIKVGPRVLSDRLYLNLVENIIISLFAGLDPTPEILRAAALRNSLG